MNWKNLKGFEDWYEVSSTGLIRSKERKVSFGNVWRIIKPNIIKPFKKSNGYLEVKLSIHNKKYHMYVHRAVALSFLDKYIDKEVNHKDGNKENNNLYNLEWVNRSQNIKHRMVVLGYKH